VTYAPYPYQGPYQPGSYYPPPRPVKVARPATIRTLITLGVVFGLATVVALAVALFNPIPKYDFSGSSLTVDLEPDVRYWVREDVPRVTTQPGTCQVTGPDDAEWNLQVKDTKVHSKTERGRGHAAPYVFTTDTAGQYTFVCRHDSSVGTDGSFWLTSSTDDSSVGSVSIVVALFLFGPATAATLIPGVVMRRRAQRFAPAWGTGYR